MDKSVAFIGSRDLNQFSSQQISLYISAAREVVRNDCQVVTGACTGADQLAAETALGAGGKILLVLPWAGYESEWIEKLIARHQSHVSLEVYNHLRHKDWTRSVVDLHPAVGNLKAGAFALHARNYGIVYRCLCVIALPGYSNNGGGTAQGLRVADRLSIKRFDLRSQHDCEVLSDFLSGE